MRNRIAVYLRTSLEDYGKAHRLLDQSCSITNQRKLIRAWLAEREELNGLEVVEYIDDGFTGTNIHRPGFQGMLRDVEAGRVGAVIVKDLSRLGRSYLEVGNYLERIFPLAGVRVIAVNDGYDSADFTGATGGINIAFRNFIYESYSRDLSTKVRSAMRVRMEKGKFISNTPYGYRKSPEDKHMMIPDPETAPIVRDIFRMAMEGRSCSEVAAKLNGRGVPTPLQYKRHKVRAACQNRELLWTHITVVNILRNYKYTGAMVNHTRESRHLRDKSQRRTPPEEWIVTENAHEPLVSRETFERANAMLRHPKKTKRRSGESHDAVFFCGHCGRKLRKTFGGDVYFSCGTPSYQTRAACRGLRWSKSELEKALLPVYRVQLELLGEKAAGLQQESGADRAASLVHRMTQIERELQSIDRRKMRLFEDYHDGKLDLTAYLEQKAGLTRREKQLQAERMDAETAHRGYLEHQEQQRAEKARIASYLSNAQLPDGQLATGMYEAIDRVYVFQKSIEVRWRFEDIFFGMNMTTENVCVPAPPVL